MKSMVTNRKSISGLAAILSLVLCFVQPSVRAQELEPRWAAAAASGDGLPVDQFSMNYGKVSFGYGQTLRLNFTYAVDPAQASQLPLAIRAMALFRDTSGNTIYISAANGGVWKTRDSGQSWSFEVNRDQLPLAGAPRTGAVAIVPELVIEAPAGVGADFPTSLEITENLTGKVEFHQQGKFLTLRPRPVDGGRQTLVFFLGGIPAPISVSRGQTLRVNLTHLLPTQLANQPLSGEVSITFYDLNGVAHATFNATTTHGQTLSFDLDRDQLNLDGDPGTGRALLRPEIHYRLRLDAALGAQLLAQGEMSRLLVSTELVDNNTGRSNQGWGSWEISPARVLNN